MMINTFKLDLQINAAIYFKDKGRPSGRLSTVMFRRTLFTNRQLVLNKQEMKVKFKVFEANT